MNTGEGRGTTGGKEREEGEREVDREGTGLYIHARVLQLDHFVHDGMFSLCSLRLFTLQVYIIIYIRDDVHLYNGYAHVCRAALRCVAYHECECHECMQRVTTCYAMMCMHVCPCVPLWFMCSCYPCACMRSAVHLSMNMVPFRGGWAFKT